MSNTIRNRPQRVISRANDYRNGGENPAYKRGSWKTGSKATLKDFQQNRFYNGRDGGYTTSLGEPEKNSPQGHNGWYDTPTGSKSKRFYKKAVSKLNRQIGEEYIDSELDDAKNGEYNDTKFHCVAKQKHHRRVVKYRRYNHDKPIPYCQDKIDHSLKLLELWKNRA